MSLSAFFRSSYVHLSHAYSVHMTSVIGKQMAAKLLLVARGNANNLHWHNEGAQWPKANLKQKGERR